MAPTIPKRVKGVAVHTAEPWRTPLFQKKGTNHHLPKPTSLLQKWQQEATKAARAKHSYFFAKPHKPACAADEAAVFSEMNNSWSIRKKNGLEHLNALHGNTTTTNTTKTPRFDINRPRNIVPGSAGRVVKLSAPAVLLRKAPAKGHSSRLTPRAIPSENALKTGYSDGSVKPRKVQEKIHNVGGGWGKPMYAKVTVRCPRGTKTFLCGGGREEREKRNRMALEEVGRREKELDELFN
jgi:hypothetical protein